jgi:hypothetical protein
MNRLTKSLADLAKLLGDDEDNRLKNNIEDVPLGRIDEHRDSRKLDPKSP